jgi:hypothetical protein
MINVLGLFLAYDAAGITIYHWFEISIPLPKTIENSNCLSIGTFIVLPILGIVSIRYQSFFLFRMLGYVYLGLWLLALFRLLSIMFSK